MVRCGVMALTQAWGVRACSPTMLPLLCQCRKSGLLNPLHEPASQYLDLHLRLLAPNTCQPSKTFQEAGHACSFLWLFKPSASSAPALQPLCGCCLLWPFHDCPDSWLPCPCLSSGCNSRSSSITELTLLPSACCHLTPQKVGKERPSRDGTNAVVPGTVQRAS